MEMKKAKEQYEVSKDPKVGLQPQVSTKDAKKQGDIEVKPNV